MYNEELLILIKKAFKKLKSKIYYDKTTLALRDNIVKYEAEDCIEKKLDNLAKILATSDNEKIDTYIKENILDKIKIIALPKNVPSNCKSDNTSDDNSRVILNYEIEDKFIYNEYEDIQFFIDMPVEGHILGMLWILLVGYKLDEKLVCCYGNRIKERLYNDKGEVSFSPYTFQPYYQNYEMWRDEALDIAQRLINDDKNTQNALILTIDFKRYYYSVDISEIYMNDIMTELYDNSSKKFENIGSTLNTFIYKVCNEYSIEYYSSIQKEYKRCILPIGFYPSAILANHFLVNFDKVVIDTINPVYYGRYVDDIIMVDKIENGSSIYEIINSNTCDKKSIFDYYFIDDKIKIQAKVKTKANFEKESIFKFISDNNGEKGIWKLNNYFLPSGSDRAEIFVKNDKLKLFYFKNGESDALIRCFRELLLRNKSEFNYMPEDNAIFHNDDISEIYNISSITTNKLRDINGLNVDKYKLSKYIGKIYRIQILVDDDYKEAISNIKQIFTPTIILDNYILWEKIIGICYNSKNISEYQYIIKKIAKVIESIDGEYSYILKESLMNHLRSSIYRQIVFTQKNREKFNIKELKRDNTEFLDMINYYISTRMFDKNTCILSPAYCVCKNDKEDYSIQCNIDMMVSNENIFKLNDKYIYYPYMINEWDLSLLQCISDLQNEDKRFARSDNEFINKYWNINYVLEKDKPLLSENKKSNSLNLNDKYIDDNNNLKKAFSCEYEFFSCGDTKIDKLRVAVGNIKLKLNDFKDNIISNGNYSRDRYESIVEMVNTAINQKANMLILPENVMPLRWLSAAIRTCKNEGMALITGLEHIIIGKNVYNLTAVVLPYMDKRNGKKSACVSFHLKNHMSPGEKDLINKYGFIPIENFGKSKYGLYHWNDVWFSVYCCYELASISDRAIFESYVDLLIAVEWNKDVNYFSNIIESMSRDVHCYCVQANTSDYGDSCIIKPVETEKKVVLRIKGGENATVMIGEVDIKALRDFQEADYGAEAKRHGFKALPPRFSLDIARERKLGKLKARILVDHSKKNSRNKSED